MATTLQTSGVPTDYYAPNYKVEVGGKELGPDIRGDVLDVKVVMDMDNMTSCDLTVNNWDDRKRVFKYSDTETFDIGKQIHVQMGYADRLVSMMRGQVSSLSPRFPESGPSTIGVSALDGMLALRDKNPGPDDVKQFVNKADYEIAQIVAQRNKLKVVVTPEGEKHAIVVQKNQDDAQFLIERAKRIDFDCYVLTDPGSGEATLHFEKPRDGRQGGSRVYQFEWGKNLINFTPTLNMGNQVSEVTVNGWNPNTKKGISKTARLEDLPCKGKGLTGPGAVMKSLGSKNKVVVKEPVTSEQEARDLAISLLAERAYDFLTGTGQVIGLPDMRPGDNLELKGLGTRFSGLYYVKRVEHSLGSSGYKTDFQVRRICDGGLA